MAFKYIVNHSHEYGETIFTIISPIDLRNSNYNDEYLKVLAAKCGINFEPEKGETLTINEDYDDAIRLTEEDAQEIVNSAL